MNEIFGSENKQPTQKMLQEEIDFASGKNTDVMINIQMCDDCEWSWINLNVNVQSRVWNNGNNKNEEMNKEDAMNKYKSYSDEDFKNT